MTKDIILKSGVSDSSLSVNGVVYDLVNAPEYTDALVVQQKEDLLLQIDLNELNDNLYLSVELLYVAYNGVAGAQGGKLQAEINSIMGDLALLCNQCIGTMSAFKDETANIINQLGQTYKYLIAGKENLAIIKIRNCGASSSKMAAKATELSTKFTELQVRSVATRSNTILEEASENDKKVAAQKAIEELNAKSKTEKVNQEELVAQVAEVQTLYDDAKSREEEASKKSLILGITSAICGAVGAGLGAFAAAKNPVGSAISSMNNQNANAQNTAQTEAAQKDADAKKAKADEANAQVQDANDKLTIAKNNLTAYMREKAESENEISIIEQVDEATRTQAQKNNLETLKTSLTAKIKSVTDTDAEITRLNGIVTTATKTSKDNLAAYGAAAAALQNISGKMDSMATAAATAEQSISQEKMTYLNKKFDLEAQKRKSLVAMSEFAENIKNSEIVKGNATVSVNSLHAAVEALGKIIGTLTNASLFWKQMADFCSKMLESGFQKDINDLLDPTNGLSLKDRVTEYQDTALMFTFLKYMCQWVALNGLSAEYLVSASNAQKKCVQNLAQSPTIDEARLRAPELAKSMSLMLTQKMQLSNAASSEILAEQARLEATTTKTN